jgi:dihydroneopterin aldolase
MTSAQFRERKTELQTCWMCPSCDNTTRRNRNSDDAPASPAGIYRHSTQMQNSQITDMSIGDESDISKVLGDTVTDLTRSHVQNPQFKFKSTQAHTEETDATITYDRFSQLIKAEFEAIKESLTKSITENIKNAVIKEFNTNMTNLKMEITHNTAVLTEEQAIFRGKINDISETIKKLQSENTKLQEALDGVTKQIANPMNITTTRDPHHNQNSIVMYGINEFRGENEYDLIERISHIFYEILGIDVNGFVDSITRIGRRGNRRPIEIGLINKRMTKYILNNHHRFRNTGLAVTKLMDQLELKKRYTLKETFRDARRKGLNPIVKKDEVYVNGRQYILPSETQSKEHPQIREPNSSQSIEALNGVPNSSAQVHLSNLIEMSGQVAVRNDQNTCNTARIQESPHIQNKGSNNTFR